MQLRENLDTITETTRAELSCHQHDDNYADIKSTEASLTAMSTSTSQEYESSSTLTSDKFSTPDSTSHAANASSRARIEMTDQHDKKTTLEIHPIGSDISPLELPSRAFSSNTSIAKKLSEPNWEEDEEEEAKQSKDGKVIISAEWPVSLANTVARIHVDQDLDTALADAAAAGRAKASMEEEQTKARIEAESQVKQLRERLEEKIQDVLMLELELENAQDSMKEKEKEFKCEKNDLQSKMYLELESMRNERTALMVKIAGLEEENGILCGKLLGGSGREQNKTGFSTACRRRILSRLYNLKHYMCRDRPWKRRNRGVQL